MTIGTLAVNVVAKTGGLVKGLRKGRSLVKGFAVAATAAAATATASIAGMIRIFDEVAPSIDKITKAARRLDVGTEPLSALGHAAGLAGSNVDELVKGMTLMERNTADAAMGVGEAKQAFSALGLDAEKLQGMQADQMFLEIADAIAKLPTAAERTSAAMDIFGRSGANLLPLMMQGREGIEAAMEEAKRLGITFTESQGAMIEAANDARTKIGAAITGLKNQFAIGLAPAITVAADAVSKWVASLNDGATASGLAGGAAQFFARGLGVVADVAHTVRLGFLKVQAVYTSVLAFITRKITDVVSFAIRQINRLPGIEIDNPQMLTVLAEEFERTADELNAKFDKLFTGKTPSERMQKMFDEIEQRAAKATEKVAEVPKQLVSPQAKAIFEKIGGMIGAIASGAPQAIGEGLGAAAGQAAVALANGAGAQQQQRANHLVKFGTVEAYKAIRESQRQDGSKKVQQNQLTELKKHTTGFDKVVTKLGELKGSLGGLVADWS